MNIDFAIDLIVAEEKPASPVRQLRRWTREEDDFLRENLGVLGIAGVAEVLGRSTSAVKVHHTRKGIAAPSKRPGWLTGQDVARYLGVDIHAVMSWHQTGLMKFEIIPGKRQILNIRKVALYRWATRPQHWIYFRVHQMRDFHLKRLVMRAQKLWGDRWLTIGEAAEFLNCDSKSLNMRIHRGKIPEARKNGNWFIPASALREITIYPGKGGFRAQQLKSRIITRADIWLLRAKYKL